MGGGREGGEGGKGGMGGMGMERDVEELVELFVVVMSVTGFLEVSMFS